MTGPRVTGGDLSAGIRRMTSRQMLEARDRARALPGARQIELDVGVAQMGRLLQAMLVGPDPWRSIEEQRWEDDGGPAFPEPAPWTHTIVAARGMVL